MNYNGPGPLCMNLHTWTEVVMIDTNNGVLYDLKVQRYVDFIC